MALTSEEELEFEKTKQKYQVATTRNTIGSLAKIFGTIVIVFGVCMGLWFIGNLDMPLKNVYAFTVFLSSLTLGILFLSLGEIIKLLSN